MLARKFILSIFCIVLLANNCSSADKSMIPTFSVVLQNINIDRLANLRRDYLIIDYSFDGSENAEIPYTDISRLKESGKKVFAYLCLGEAEDYRFYWKESYNTLWPSWIVRENPDWKGNYLVRYWDPNWKEILLIYMDRIKAAGFDGLFLDKVDAYYDFKEEELPEIDKKEEMKSLLRFILEKNKIEKKDFQIVLNGGEEVALEDTIIKDGCLGILVESLYTNGKNQERPAEEYGQREKDLKTLDRLNKKIFILEYISDKTLQYKLKKIARKNHFSIEFTNPDLS
jgi:cysteinyl-tRNA synthetase, unknown class